MVVAGRAEPGAEVALLDNGKTVLQAKTNATNGEFVLLPPRLDAGAHKLSLRSTTLPNGAKSKERFVMAVSIAPRTKAKTSDVAKAAPSAPAAAKPAPSASVVAKTEPQAKQPASSPVAADNAARIVRGDTLWRISRERFGRGALYPKIYHANSNKIRNPNLIYPGQVFEIP